MFIAFELPENIIIGLKQIQCSLKQTGMALRWVQPKNMHLTLKFLGTVSAERCKEIEAVIAEATDGFNPLNLRVKGIGVFPNIKKARVLWAGLSGETAALLNFQQNLDTCLAQKGICTEKKPFKAHLTLGRIKRKIDPNQLLNALGAFSDFETERFRTHRIVLFESDLRPTGAVYTPVYARTFT